MRTRTTRERKHDAVYYLLDERLRDECERGEAVAELGGGCINLKSQFN